MLRLNGYSTAAFGKWHETAAWETSVSGPYDRWPTHQGFDKFYGFIGGETDQWYPLIYDGVTRVTPPKMEEYHFTTDMTNQAINWVQGAAVDDAGQAVLRLLRDRSRPRTAPRPEEVGGQVQGPVRRGLGRGPGEVVRSPEGDGIDSGEHQAAARKRGTSRTGMRSLQTRRSCSRARRRSSPDSSSIPITRSVASSTAIEDIGEMDNTLFIYIAGDNGTSGEGGAVGMFNEMTYFNAVAEKVEDLLPKLDEWGGPYTFPHMASGWAVAFDSPFSWMKQVASDFGGTRNGMVIHWPKGIKEKGGLRTQFGHVIDIAPTVLEAAMLPEPKSVNGTPQTPIAGTSLLYSFNDAKAKERHTTQYFEIFGNRAMYHEGWFARTIHRAPWETSDLPPLESDNWELYNVREDFSLANNVADQNPDKLKELKALFDRDAERYNVYPIDDRVIERMNPDDRRTSGSDEGPDLAHALRRHERHAGEHVHQREEQVEDDHGRNRDPEGRRQWRDPDARWAVRWLVALHEGRQARLHLQLPRPVPLHGGRDQAAARQGRRPWCSTSRTTAAEWAKAASATLQRQRRAGGEGPHREDPAAVFSADETADVGLDNQTPVAEGIGIGRDETRFTGKITR